jgi:hypothetical protein
VTQRDAVNITPQGDTLSLLFEGGLAESGALLLDEYAASLDGWRDILQQLGQLYFHSFPELQRIRGSDLLRVEIAGERRGSYETVLNFVLLAMAAGIIGNRVDATIVWTFKKLVEWYRDAVSRYVREKMKTTDVVAIAAALREMTEGRGIPLDQEEFGEETQALFPEPATERDEQLAEPATAPAQVDRAQALAEKLDSALKRATQPLDRSCERVKVLLSDGTSLLEIGQAERAVIAAPLTLPPPKREWREARIKFERINRKTGRALFYFDGEDTRHAAHYSRIIDAAVHEPHNRYTQAFNDDEALNVWIRQTHPEPGRLNFQWEIMAKNPEAGTLFDLPPGDTSGSQS